MRKKRQREEKLRLKKKNESQNLRKMLFFSCGCSFFAAVFFACFYWFVSHVLQVSSKQVGKMWRQQKKEKNAEKIETDEERSAFFVNVGVFFHLIDFPAYSSHVFRMFYAFWFAFHVVFMFLFGSVFTFQNRCSFSSRILALWWTSNVWPLTSPQHGPA